MKLLLGITQAIFGFLLAGFIGLFVMVSIAIIMTQDMVDSFTKKNNEEDKDYYKFT